MESRDHAKRLSNIKGDHIISSADFDIVNVCFVVIGLHPLVSLQPVRDQHLVIWRGETGYFWGVTDLKHAVSSLKGGARQCYFLPPIYFRTSKQGVEPGQKYFFTI